MMSDFYPGDWGFLASQHGLGYGIYGVPYFFGAHGFAQPGGFENQRRQHRSNPTMRVVNGQGYTRADARAVPRHRDGDVVVDPSSAGDASSSSGAGSGGDSGVSSSGASPSGYSGWRWQRHRTDRRSAVAASTASDAATRGVRVRILHEGAGSSRAGTTKRSAPACRSG